MADQSIQEHRPHLRESGTIINAAHKNSFLTTYGRVAVSFRCSASANDLRRLEGEKKDTRRIESWKYVSEKCTSKHKIESSSTSQNIAPSLSDAHKSHSGWKRFLTLWKKSSIKRLPPLVAPKVSRRFSRSARESCDFIDRCPLNSHWTTFTLAQLEAATNNFSQENLIGKGGYAQVYKGCLANGQLVAVKRLKKGIGEDDLFNFLSEIGIIAHINHPNTAKMIGYGVEGGAFLVLHLSSLGSLGSRLHGSNEKLEWSKRYKIILGIAEGLRYLHESCERRIIHRDIKADNILLCEDYEPQICDFGLSKWLPKQWSHHNATKFEGTFGYFAPEYFMHGIVDEKTDVFSFGVLLLEIVTGRQALDESKKSLVLWAKPLLDKNEVKELVDPSLGNDNYDEEEMSRVISTASSCIEQSPVLRPRMSQVITLLKGDIVVEKSKGQRRQLHQRTYSEELSHVEEYNKTKRLIDCNKNQRIQLIDF
ncbi:hypothetical protein ACS0TY_002119 [Phlomoides rotata]